MEVGIRHGDEHVGWSIKDMDIVFCCEAMTHAYHMHEQIHIGIRLGKPAFVISCQETLDIIGQYCPFCGEIIMEVMEGDDNNG